MGDAPELRISDADRTQAVERLRHHTGEGRLTLDEFADRVEVVFAARTRSELAPAFEGLPTQPSPPTAPAPAAPPATAPSTKQRSRWVVAIMGGSGRRGRWRASRRTVAVAIMGGVVLDLRGATIDGDEIEIDCWAVMGGVEVIVPEGFPVDFDGFMLMGGRDERLADVALVPGAPTIRVRGYGFWGGVTVRSKPQRPPGEESSRGRDRQRQRHDRGHDGAEEATPPLLPPPVSDLPLPTMPPRREPVTSDPAPPPAGSSQRAEPIIGEVAAGAGLSPPPGASGTVTILVTDIVGSTAHAERLGDQGWLLVLRSHNALVREALHAHGGTEVKQSGDGFLATFASARSAVRSALAVRQAIEGYRQTHPEAPLVLRIGLHAGEVEHDGDDVFGINVSTASRIAGAAEPGEVLVSGIVRDLADSTSDLCFGAAREVGLAGRALPLRVHTASTR